MKRQVESVEINASLQQAAIAMRDANVGFLPVCDRERVVGTLTDRDIVVRGVAAGAADACVAAIMTPEVITCAPEEDIDALEARMRDHHVGRLVCVDDQHSPIGVVSFKDIEAQHAEQPAYAPDQDLFHTPSVH